MMRIIAFSAVLASLLTGCDGAPDAEQFSAANEIAAAEAMEGAGNFSGTAIPFASDPNATFEIVSSKPLLNGNLEVVTKRNGPSGTSFSRREISCGQYTFRYLGEGDTLEDAMRDSANQGEMSALTGTSASSDVANEACKATK